MLRAPTEALGAILEGRKRKNARILAAIKQSAVKWKLDAACVAHAKLLIHIRLPHMCLCLASRGFDVIH